MSAAAETGRARAVAESLPAGGLLRGKTWRITPEPFRVPLETAHRIARLGRHLERFVRGCARLYRMSADGRLPGWIAELLDRGKPAELVAHQRRRPHDIPLIIRPDLVLTREGFVVTELDSVPGGIGLTAWLGHCYSGLGCEVAGGADGMAAGFVEIFPGGDVLISQEAADYRPEMEWLTDHLNKATGNLQWRVVDAGRPVCHAKRVYRFFELFDLPSVPSAMELMEKVETGEALVTPPFKPALEEKLLFALFWLKPLEPFWLDALGGRTLRVLREIFPYTWLVHPETLPPHAVLPRLEAHSWREVAAWSQRERGRLVLKISGFSPRAWGARGVVPGADVPGVAWREALEKALADWPHSPWILQEFHPSALFEHPWWNPATNELEMMAGRVRLCPYYFVREGEDPLLGGVLATICPADKKLLHGMPEAILAPCAAEGFALDHKKKRPPTCPA